MLYALALLSRQPQGGLAEESGHGLRFLTARHPNPMSSLQEPSHYISTAILQNNYYCPHFGDEKTEPQVPKSQTKDKSPHYLHCITVSSLIQHVSENNGKTVSYLEHSKKGFICIPFLNPHSNIKKKIGLRKDPKIPI